MTAALEGGEWSAVRSGRTLLTYSMVQSPWEANWFAASQEIPRTSGNPKVHYRTHKRPPNVSILGQPNPVHIPTSHLLEIHLNIIRPSTPRSPQWSPSLRFPHQDPIQPTSICFENQGFFILRKAFVSVGMVRFVYMPTLSEVLQVGLYLRVRNV